MEQTFGSYVREKRMARGLSLRALAAKLEVSPDVYKRQRFLSPPFPFRC